MRPTKSLIAKNCGQQVCKFSQPSPANSRQTNPQHFDSKRVVEKQMNMTVQFGTANQQEE